MCVVVGMIDGCGVVCVGTHLTFWPEMGLLEAGWNFVCGSLVGAVVLIDR